MSRPGWPARIIAAQVGHPTDRMAGTGSLEKTDFLTMFPTQPTPLATLLPAAGYKVGRRHAAGSLWENGHNTDQEIVYKFPIDVETKTLARQFEVDVAGSDQSADR